ncbi:hypothetical protein H4582DRAFT_1962464 [Lactarius indigo]|nr:hypothetical protein H4582DRAFT_1962464 [Lactarius indigo]
MPTHDLDPFNRYDVETDYRNSFTVLVWDHIATFPDELVYLFFLNRYLIPLSFIVNLCAYFRLSFSRSWFIVLETGDSYLIQSKSCDHFVRFEGSMTMLGVSVVAWMMFLRIRFKPSLLPFLLTYIGANSYLLTRGIPCLSCKLCDTTRRSGVIASSSAWLPLLYDTVVVSLTLYRTAGTVYSENASTGEIFRVMLREGLLYYSAICTVTLAFTIMIVSADPSVRNITGHLTVAMMSRITLHLKRFGKGRHPAIASYAASNPKLGTLPTVSFTPGSLTPSPTPSDTEGEYFAMKPRSSAAAGAPLLHPTSRAGTNLAGSSTSPVTIDLGGP